MVRFLAYTILGLVAAIFLLTYGVDRISQPSNFSVFIGLVEILLAIIVLALVARYTYIKLKINN
ncbi:MAG: hypothetical protein EOP46_04110 [Sphingobacteriaceae bacterium]|nr:MAG: hypothetical protein EOP46_04110 [Sphingobacteriaceae bacterium]